MDPELIDLLRADLDAAGYTAPAVAALLGEPADDARRRGSFAAARRALAKREPGPLPALVRLLLLGEALTPAEVDAALPRLTAAGALDLGLVAPRDDRFVAALSLNPERFGAGDDARDLRVLSDLDDQLRRGPARPDHVMGVGGATRSLLAQAPARRVGRALDLGTGCGIVALRLAERAERVIATDISERALRLAAANARLNGLEARIEFRHGDLFTPVAGEAFDLILSNPPFVITPRGDGSAPVYEYRDGGRAGDELAEAVVLAAPAHLAPGGQALCLANWESRWGSPGLTRVRGWLDEAHRAHGPLAAWVVERDRIDPARYAETWARDGGDRPGEAATEARIDAWLADFAARRVHAVGLGSIRVARLEARGGDDAERGPVARLEAAAGAFAADPGAALDRAFAVGIAAERADDDAVLATRWVRDEAVTELRTHRPGEEAPSAIVLETDRPIARRVTADPLLAAAVGACDGELELGRIADALATLLEVDAGAAREALAAGARELAWFGMLAPAEQGAGPGGR